MNRSEYLNRAKAIVNGERQEQYGSPENSFALIADLWGAYLQKPLYAQDVALMMCLLKIGRVRTGDWNGTPDTFVDLAGYAACAGEIWSKQNEEDEED